MASDIHEKGDTANLGFSSRLFTLAEPYDRQGGWREVERPDQAQPMADQVLAQFDEYAEPWFERLSDARFAVEALRGSFVREALPVEAGVLLANVPTVRCLEVADGLDLLATPEPADSTDELVTRLRADDARVNRWLADKLRRHAGGGEASLPDLLDWPSRDRAFYSTPAEVRSRYDAALRETLAALAAVELDPELLNRHRLRRRSRDRNPEEPS